MFVLLGKKSITVPPSALKNLHCTANRGKASLLLLQSSPRPAVESAINSAIKLSLIEKGWQGVNEFNVRRKQGFIKRNVPRVGVDFHISIHFDDFQKENLQLSPILSSRDLKAF